MGVDVLPFQDAHQLHFDVVAASVAHGTLGGSRHDEVILVLGCALFNGTNGIFPDVAGEPLIHGRHSVAPSLQLLNGHRAHFQQAVGQKVLDALLGGSHLHSVCLGAGGVLQAALGHKLEHRPLCPRQCGAEGCQHLLGLFHGWGGGQLLGRGGVRRQEVGLQKLQIHGLRGRSGNNEVLLCHQPLFQPPGLVVSAASALVRHKDASFYKVVPPKDLFGPELETVQQLHVGAVGQGQLILAKGDKAVHCLVVIVDARVGDQVVDPLHLHGNFPAYGYFATHHGLPKTAVVDRRGRVR